MNVNKQIKNLEKQIKKLKIKQHNEGMNNAAQKFVKKLKERATPAELKFMEIAKYRKIKLQFQHRIDVVDKDGMIKQFFIADFCDVKNKVVFEIDGDYHMTPEQQKKDWIRTKTLNRLGYRVFRITNEDVFAGKTTMLLCSAYPKLKEYIYSLHPMEKKPK